MNTEHNKLSKLLDLKDSLDAREEKHLCNLATLSRQGIRRSQGTQTGHRQAFARVGYKNKRFGVQFSGLGSAGKNAGGLGY